MYKDISLHMTTYIPITLYRHITTLFTFNIHTNAYIYIHTHTYILSLTIFEHRRDQPWRLIADV